MLQTRKVTSFVLVFLMLLSTVLAGCASSTSPEPAPQQDNKDTSQKPEEKKEENKRNVGGLELPIADSPTKLSIWAVQDGNFRGKDYNEKPSFQKMAENTNINLEWQLASGANGIEQFNLLMASGKLPDMVFYWEMGKEAANYGQQGAFIALEDYIKEHAPNFNKILNDNPDVRRLLTSPDGHIYYFPQLSLDPKLAVLMFPQIRKDWLEKVNLNEPTTTEEWYNVLKAFREQDPNKNSKKDEIPLVSISLRNIMLLFAPAFGVEYDFYVDNGQVKYGPKEDKFKDLLGYLSKLYSEQLIDPNYLVDNDFKLLTEKVTTDRAGAWIGWAGSYMRSFSDLMKDHPTFDLVGLVPPKGPNGDQRHSHISWPVGGVGVAVSVQNKNIEQTIKWLDYQYSEEGILLNNFGVEGESYDLVDGNPKFKDLIFNNPNGLSATESLLSYTIGGGSWSTVTDPRYAAQYDIPKAAEAKAKVAPFVDRSKKLPPLQLLPEENDIVVPLMADINTFLEETTNAFVMGRKPSSEFEDFQNTLIQLKIDQVLEVYQKAYDRYQQN
jgi:putative aldouronate transport system substrate-binding protein